MKIHGMTWMLGLVVVSGVAQAVSPVPVSTSTATASVSTLHIVEDGDPKDLNVFIRGNDHERLTYRYAGRDFRLTDVHGEVVKAILA